MRTTLSKDLRTTSLREQSQPTSHCAPVHVSSPEVASMSTRIFALIIGINNYKSGNIWNLENCVDDAKRMRAWLVNALNVPEDQVCLLLDSQATKGAIEDKFMTHLMNNRAIEKGDAILVYFAGHGSTIHAPNGWFQETTVVTKSVDVLCTYDYDVKSPYGRIAGISDKSMRAMLYELSQIKGNNITLMLDTCFSPAKSRGAEFQRNHTRWTPTMRALPDDLYRSLWAGARGRPYESPFGFLAPQKSHVCLAACENGKSALEGKEGGKFTNQFLEAMSELPLHRISYAHLVDFLRQSMGGIQQAVCFGINKNRVVFDGVPFSVDSRFLPVSLESGKRVKVEAGIIHGLVEGSELSLHIHNYRCSKNPPITTVVVDELHSTWCFARSMNPKVTIPKMSWGKITRWNNRRPFRVNLKATLTSLIRMWKFRRSFSSKMVPPPRYGLNIMRVRKATQADISLTLGHQSVTVERHDDAIVANHRRVVKIEKRTGDEVLADAARFHLHLHRHNPEAPMKNLISLELYRLHSEHWTKVGGNLLQHGKAIIPYEQDAIFSISIHNKSDMDLWPYLAYMDPNCYGITMLYHPDHTNASPPLPRHGCLEIGSGKSGSEALSFTLSDHEHLDSGFLKLFLSPTPISLAMIEQGPSLAWTTSVDVESVPSSPIDSEKTNRVWDTVLASVVFVRQDVPPPVKSLKYFQ